MACIISVLILMVIVWCVPKADQRLMGERREREHVLGARASRRTSRARCRRLLGVRVQAAQCAGGRKP